jgi:TRAP-type C4-dicarboxylate transport system substrate-binding protein
MRHFRTFAAVAAVSLALGAGTAQAQTIKWDMPTPYSDGTFQTVNVREFVADIKTATNGRLDITVHSNASLVRMPEMRRAVATGQVQIGELLISVLANEDAMFGFESVPGVATSYADARKLYAAARAHVEARLDRAGLVMLYSVAWPPQAIYTKKPINALAELRGTKFRSFNPSTARFAELLGATPTTIQVPEIAQAFRTGVLDAMITSGATGVDSQAWDYLTHFYDVQAFLPQNAVIVNKAAFQALPADVQAAIRAAAQRAEERGWKRSEELAEEYKRTLASRGIQVLPATETMKAELKRIGEQMATEWAQRAGADGQAVLNAFRR